MGQVIAINIKDKGNLTISLAYAQMAGEVVFKSSVQNNSFEGATTGLSYGIEWSGPLTTNMIYRLGYKAHRYRFTQDELTAAELAAGNEDMSSDVIFNMFYLGVSNFF